MSARSRSRGARRRHGFPAIGPASARGPGARAWGRRAGPRRQWWSSWDISCHKNGSGSARPAGEENDRMCRSIKTLHNFVPPATDEEIRASALQFVRKLSGFTRPSKANEPAFARAVDEVTTAAHTLLDSLVTGAPPRHREVEAAKARARAAVRYARQT